ncbi:hypothetical protein QTO34_014273 [Cnephaeus nilssonii]|uniref:ferroxidase n=1 Tax=Cnephaeus nilssonii TaxID=3371016 RepID=A0AA40I624_CNENI|nr:hypothetical protein QTO34_014273 [Eptesicus nilssonii]
MARSSRPSPYLWEGTQQQWGLPESMKAFFNVSNCQKSSADEHGTRVIHYYIAAEKTLWNYAPSGIDLFTGKPLTAAGCKSQIYFEQGPTRIGGTYQKLVYREYTDASFQTQKAREEHLGILGPVIKAEVGDTLKVTFYNNGPLPLSIQPHGLRYSKSNEGSYYKTPGGSIPPASSHVNPGTTFVYTWQVPRDVGPTSTDPNCLTWFYYSSVYGKKDTNSGLVGPLLVCRKGSLGKDGKQKGIDKEFYLLATIFDENESHLLDENIRTFTTEPETINGYMYGNLPGLDMCLGDNISWHVLSVGSQRDLHGIYFSGNTFISAGERGDTMALFPHTSQTLFMTTDSTGIFYVVCLTSQHYQGGMKHKYKVRPCSEPFPQQMQYQKEKVFYIAAEEVVWDYSPSRTWERELHHLQRRKNETNIYLDKIGTFLGSKYKKVVYRQYDDITFTKQTKRNENEKHLDILGPLIFATPGEKIRIIFKNKASRQYSIYAHGVKTQNSTVVPTQPDPGARGLTRTQGRVASPRPRVAWPHRIQGPTASPGPGTQAHPDPGAHGLTRTRDPGSLGSRGPWPHPDPGPSLTRIQGHTASPRPRIQLYLDPGAHGLTRTQGRVAFPGPGTQPHQFFLFFETLLNTCCAPGNVWYAGRAGKDPTYIWQIPERTGPTSKNFECIPWYYYSTVNLVKVGL